MNNTFSIHNFTYSFIVVPTIFQKYGKFKIKRKKYILNKYINIFQSL